VALRRDLAAAIRRYRPDTLVLFNHREGWGPGSVNSPDHRAVGQAGLEACGDAGNRWIFPDLALEPHRVQRAVVAGSPVATHAVDVTGFADQAVDSLRAHRTYLAGLGEHPMGDPEFVRRFLQGAGARAGVQEALAVELYSF
jgi:LmbE family N-acetylglucosaminyl deacetylase